MKNRRNKSKKHRAQYFYLAQRAKRNAQAIEVLTESIARLTATVEVALVEREVSPPSAFGTSPRKQGEEITANKRSLLGKILQILGVKGNA